MKRIMILGASILQLPAILKAKEMGLEVIAVDMDEYAVGFAEAHIKLVISTIDIPKIISEAQRYQINGIMTLASDMPVRTVAAVAEKMNLVGVSSETALKATNKAIMRQALYDKKVPIPHFYKVSDEIEYYHAINQMREKAGRCIVKPTENSGSRGILFLNDFEEERLRKTYAYCKSYSKNGEIVVEEYMEGPEVSVETLSIDSKCYVVQITDKITTGRPYFVEIGHNQPSLLNEEMKLQVAKIAVAANKAIGIKNGPSHTEIKVTKDGPKIVEIGARLGGDNITTHLVPLSTGVDMIKCCIQTALGEKPDITAKFKKASAIRYLKSGLGIIKEIKGIDKAELIPGVKQISIVHGIGETVREIKNSNDRIGFVIAQGETVDRAVSVCEDAVDEIKVIVKTENILDV